MLQLLRRHGVCRARKLLQWQSGVQEQGMRAYCVALAESEATVQERERAACSEGGEQSFPEQTKQLIDIVLQSLKECVEERESTDGVVGDDERRGVCCGVSGGPDSMALLWLLSKARETEEGQKYLPSIKACIVDHGIQEGSAAQALAAKEWIDANLSGVECEVLSGNIERTKDGAVAGSLQERARTMRFKELFTATKRDGILLLGHQQDDWCETMLMRLGMGSGLKGFGGLERSRRMQSVTVLRPLLDTRRETLRELCVANFIPFIDDPSNADERFVRNRIRAHLPQLLEESECTEDDLRELLCTISSCNSRLRAQAQKAASEYVSHPCTGLMVISNCESVIQQYSRPVLAELLYEALGIVAQQHITRQATLETAIDRVLKGESTHRRKDLKGVGLEYTVVGKRAELYYARRDDGDGTVCFVVLRDTSIRPVELDGGELHWNQRMLLQFENGEKVFPHSMQLVKVKDTGRKFTHYRSIRERLERRIAAATRITDAQLAFLSEVVMAQYPVLVFKNPPEKRFPKKVVLDISRRRKKDLKLWAFGQQQGISFTPTEMDGTYLDEDSFLW